jgi:hypothetical protein
MVMNVLLFAVTRNPIAGSRLYRDGASTWEVGVTRFYIRPGDGLAFAGQARPCHGRHLRFAEKSYSESPSAVEILSGLLGQANAAEQILETRVRAQTVDSGSTLMKVMSMERSAYAFSSEARAGSFGESRRAPQMLFAIR